jgi:hypothetical protein
MKLVVVAALAVCARADADPLRLRADALSTTSSPAGLLTLEADGAAGPGLSAEAVVWTGSASRTDEPHGDVLVMALRARTADGRASGRFGRFVESLGALRPVHVDGGAARVRLPRRFDAEAFAGIPVVPDLPANRSWDWVAGARISRRLGDGGSAGIAYAQQRTAGQLASEEVGLDGGLALGKRDDVAAKLAYDLANPGVAEATLSASHRKKSLRTEIYAAYRAASHLLPATSLFTVIGDVPSQRAGAVLTWYAAPRLVVTGDGGVRRSGDELAPDLVARARLSLDARGASLVGGELRRDGLGMDQWTGVRGSLRVALPHALVAASELELVIPDHARGRGRVWPWGLASLGWDHAAWQAAIAVEASSSPRDHYRVDVIGQLARRFGK